MHRLTFPLLRFILLAALVMPIIALLYELLIAYDGTLIASVWLINNRIQLHVLQLNGPDLRVSYVASDLFNVLASGILFFCSMCWLVIEMGVARGENE